MAITPAVVPRLCLLAGALGWAACGDGAVRIDRHLDAPDRNSMAWVRLHSCYDQMDRSTFTWGSYRNLLTELKHERYVTVPLAEFRAALAAHPDKIVVGVRHDMDGNFCKTWTMAEVEHELGIRSSYYVRHTEDYYAYDWPHPQRIRSILPHLRRIQGMGHEVGLHLDSMTMAFVYGFDPARLLADELAYLRGAGLTIRGTAAHGSPEARDYRFSNYELFAGMTTRTTLVTGKRRISLGAHMLDEFDLEYEAYHLGYTYYFSDVGGHWGENPLLGLPALKPGESAVILTHPEWWGADDADRKYY